MKIQIQGRFMSDPPLSDIDFKNKMTMVLSTLKTDLERQQIHEFVNSRR